MEKDIILEIQELPISEIISDKDEALLTEITSLKKVVDFDKMNLSDEKLEELIAGLSDQEEFKEKIEIIKRNLNDAPTILMEDESLEDYI